jgi:hypothetical protein
VTRHKECAQTSEIIPYHRLSSKSLNLAGGTVSFFSLSYCQKSLLMKRKKEGKKEGDKRRIK